MFFMGKLFWGVHRKHIVVITLIREYLKNAHSNITQTNIFVDIKIRNSADPTSHVIFGSSQIRMIQQNTTAWTLGWQIIYNTIDTI